MAKYSFELKLKIIHEYLEGKGGYGFLTQKYNIKAVSQIRNWVNTYREFGEEGLLRKRQNKNYSVQFKSDAIELYLTSELTYREVANQLGMNNPALITKWVRTFRESGIEGLSKRKGRPTALTAKKDQTNQPKNKQLPTTDEITDDKERIRVLEKCIRELEIKNAFLKELRKLRKQEAQQRRMNQSYESSPASEDPSN